LAPVPPGVSHGLERGGVVRSNKRRTKGFEKLRNARSIAPASRRDCWAASGDQYCNICNWAQYATRENGITDRVRCIVYLRLRRAVELIREDRLGLAEIAASTGFADQSHLSRWVRRVHGVSPTQMVS
jgi:AraC-like DNA-binding protein